MFARNVVCTLAVLLLLAALATPALATETFVGEIQGVTFGQITLMMGTEHMVFSVADDAKITLNGATVKLEDLQPGQTVKLSAERSDDVNRVAYEIAATTP